MASGVKIGSAFIEVKADADGAFKGIGATASREGENAGGFFKGSFMKGIAGLGALVAGTFALDKVKDFLGSAITGASSLNEQVSKSEAIFGSSSTSVQSWAQDAAKNVGLSELAALEATGTFGNMFTQLGFGGEEAAKLSTGVIELSGDLGSFNEMETADVADRMSAAFRGEYDSIQALLPGINAASVEQRALEMSGKDSADALTEQEKAMAVLSLANEGGAKAIGDFAKTQGGFQGQTKTAKAELENMVNTIGTGLLPIATGFMTFVNTSLLPGLKNIGTWINTNVVPAVNKFKNAFMQALPTLTTIAMVLGVVMLPALIRSGIQIALTAAAHVAAWLIMGTTATINAGIAVAAWTLMGIQSMINAVKIAAAWIIAMGPIPIIIALVVGLVAIIVLNWDTIKQWTIDTFTAVMTFLSDTWNNIVTFITTFIDTLKTNITNVFGAIKTFLTDTWNNIKTTITNVWEGIKTAISTAIESVKTFVTNGFNTVKETMSSVWTNIKTAVSDAWETVKTTVTDKIDDVISSVKELPGKAVEALGNLGSKLKDSGKALIQGFKDGITDAFGSVKDVVKNGLQAIRDLFPFSPAKEGPFSGKGYTSFSGKALASDFAKGIASNKSMVDEAAEDLLGAASGSLNGNMKLSTAAGRKIGLADSGAARSHGIMNSNTTVTNHIEVTIDAKNVKDFNDVIEIINNIPQVARAGRGSGTNLRIA